MYEVIIYKSCGPFKFSFDNYDTAIGFLYRKWFSPSVWDVRLFKDGTEIDISAIVSSWGDRPIYC